LHFQEEGGTWDPPISGARRVHRFQGEIRHGKRDKRGRRCREGRATGWNCSSRNQGQFFSALPPPPRRAERNGRNNCRQAGTIVDAGHARARSVLCGIRSWIQRIQGQRSGPAPGVLPAESADPPPSGCRVCAPLFRQALVSLLGGQVAVGNGPQATLP